MHKKIIASSSLIGSVVFSQVAMAGGFALQEQSASGLGNAYAGIGATAEDASTVFLNPAGMTRLPSASMAVSAAVIDLNSKFKNRASQAAFGQPLGDQGGQAGNANLVPAIYFAAPLPPSIAVGFGVNAPFGLKTEYDNTWMGRFQAVKSEVKTLNFNPSFAVKANDMLSFGIGADFQRLQAELTSEVNYTAVVAAGLAQIGVVGAPAAAVVAANGGLQGLSRVRGDDDAWGYDFGLLFQPNVGTRIGLTYRSALQYHVAGTASFAAPSGSGIGQTLIGGARASQAANGLADGPISLDIKLPASARASLVQTLGEQLELLADVSWMQWSSIRELRVVRDNGVTLQVTPENWRNAWRFAIGANYKVNAAWKLRAGLAYDQTPVPDAARTPRLPDEDRKWVSAGVQWHLDEKTALDAGYAHLFARNATLNQNAGSTTAYGLLDGEQRSNVNLLGVQLSLSF